MNNLCPFSPYCFLSFFCVGVITSFDDVVGSWMVLLVGWYLPLPSAWLVLCLLGSHLLCSISLLLLIWFWAVCSLGCGSVDRLCDLGF